MRIPFIGQLGAGRSENVDAQLLENWYVENDPDNPRQTNYLVQTPGMNTFLNFVSSAIQPDETVFGLHYYNSGIVAVTNLAAYLVNITTNPPTISRIDTISGSIASWIPYGMLDNGANNGKQVWFTDGANAWVYKSGPGTITLMSATQGYPTGGVSWITQQDTFGIFGVPNSTKFYVTDSFNYANVTGGNFAQAQTITDVLMCGISDNTRLYLFGETGMEVWYNSGATNFTFTRIPGAIFPVGCAGRGTPALIDNSIVWVGNNEWGGLSVFQVRGEGSPEVISSPQIDFLLNSQGFNPNQPVNFNPVSAYATVYKEVGHEFYVLHPSFFSNTCYVWDASTRQWHQRVSQVCVSGGWLAGAMAYIPASDTGGWGNNVLCGLPEIGPVIGRLDNTYNGELTSTELLPPFGQITRVIQSPHINDEDKRLFINDVQVVASFGPGTVSEPGPTSGTMTLSYSKDNGNTFPSSQTFTITSNNIQRMLFRRLGWARDWVFRLVYTAATTSISPIIIMNAFADVMYRTDGNPGTP